MADVKYRSSTLSDFRLQMIVFKGSRSARLLIYTGLVIMFAIAIAVSYSIALSYSKGEPLEDVSFLYEIPLFGFSFAQIFFGAAIIAYICAEWGSGFIYTTFGASRRPARFIASKLFWPLAFSLSTFFVILMAIIPLEGILVSHDTPYTITLADATVWRQILIACFNLATSVLFAGGLAFIFRHAASAIGSYIAISLIAPIVFGLIPLDISKTISSWLPNNVYGYLITQDPVMTGTLNYPLLFCAAIAYPVISVLVGFVRFKRNVV